MIHSAFCLLLLLMFARKLWAEPRLPHLFGDHMVLQRGTEIRIWGWSDPQESIEVSLAGASRQTAANREGQWRVSLPPLPAGGPFVLEVRGNKTLRFKDVMVGEVWVASGQSNMTYALSGAANATEEIQKANDPSLRFFTVPKKIAIEAQTDTLPAAWEVSTSDTAKNFSAVAYFFGSSLHRSLGVPVGLILSAWPGTAAEEWTDPDFLRRDPVLQPIVSRWDSVSPEEKAFAAHSRKFSLDFDDFELLPESPDSAPVSFSNFDDGSSHVSTGGTWSYSWQEALDSQFELIAPGRQGKGYAARISGELDGGSDSRWEIRLHSDGTPMGLSNFGGVRFWVRGNGTFVFRTVQPSISDWDNYSTDILKATPEWKQITVWFKDLKQAGWGVSQKLTLDQISGFSISTMTDLPDPPRPPSGLYEGMIAPLMNYRIRGAIWYQGEGNTQRAFQYRTLLPALIRGWRTRWNEGDFPFLIVQLPNQGHTEEFADSWWAELREAQLLTARTVPNTGLAVTIDVGESGNLHPPRKAEIGERLARWALGTTYKMPLEYSGPLYDSMRVEGKEIRIRFQHAGNGLKIHGDTLQGFIIAGSDRKFHRAEAHMDGNAVVVSSPEVGAPVAVRYAWEDSPACNLFNDEELPASPFRTDDWPGATFSNR
jgi:sialate O-acetylesterase